MNAFRKAYSVAGALLMLQFFLQLYFIAATLFTIVNANDNAKDVYAAFKNADSFAGLHAINGDLTALTILVMLVLSFAARLPRQTKIMTGVLFALIIIQVILAHTGIAVISALHGINALVLIALGGFLTGRNWAFGRRTEPVPTTP
jgi:Family of unknown function (DUF6220)